MSLSVTSSTDRLLKIVFEFPAVNELNGCDFKMVIFKLIRQKTKFFFNFYVNLVPIRSKKAWRFKELLGYARSHSIVTRGSVTLSCATTQTFPAFVNLNGIILRISNSATIAHLKLSKIFATSDVHPELCSSSIPN